MILCDSFIDNSLSSASLGQINTLVSPAHYHQIAAWSRDFESVRDLHIRPRPRMGTRILIRHNFTYF